jgi:general secretion pathway protein D
MAEKGKLEVLSRPAILARNNQEAVITVGQRFPFITDSRITDSGQTINTITYSDIGIILRVTPFITSSGLVEMIVAPEISTLTEQTVPLTDTVSSPVIALRSAETVVVTPDGVTVVIGGLMENNKTESVRKIPLLGDIPLLGAAFRRTIREDTKTELLIFLTPLIVHEPHQLADLSALEASKSEFTSKAFSQRDLDKFIDNLPVKDGPPAGTAPPTAAPRPKRNSSSNPGALDRRRF